MHDFIDGFLQRMSLGDKLGQLNHANAQSETTTGVGVAVSGGTAALDRVLPGDHCGTRPEGLGVFRSARTRLAPGVVDVSGPSALPGSLETREPGLELRDLEAAPVMLEDPGDRLPFQGREISVCHACTIAPVAFGISSALPI